MTFPTIPTTGAGRVLTANQANTTAARTFPSLSSLTKNSGDLLIAIITAYSGATTTTANFGSWGGGFTEIYDNAGAAGGGGMAIGVAYKISDGTETGTFTVTQAATISGHASMILLSIPGAHASSAPEVGGYNRVANGAPNIASFNPSWAAEDILWIAVGAAGETSATGSWTATGGPTLTNYSSGVNTATADTSTVGQTELGVLFCQLNADSEDPAAFGGFDTSNSTNAGVLIAVRPSANVTVTPSTVSSTSTVQSVNVAVDPVRDPFTGGANLSWTDWNGAAPSYSGNEQHWSTAGYSKYSGNMPSLTHYAKAAIAKDSGDGYAGVNIRVASGTTQTFYAAAIENIQADPTINIVQWVAGTPTVIATALNSVNSNVGNTAAWIGTDATRTLEIGAVDEGGNVRLRVKVAGVEVLSYLDSSAGKITTGLQAGTFGSEEGTGGSWVIDDFEAGTYTPPATGTNVSVSTVASTSTVRTVTISAVPNLAVSTVTSTSTVRAPTLVTPSNVPVSTVASTSAVPAVGITAVPTLTVATVASTSTVRTVALSASANVAPATVVSTSAVPSVLPGTPTIVTPATVASTSTVRTVTISASANVAPATVASTSTVPAVTALPQAIAAVSTVVSTSSVPAVSLTASANVAVSTVASTSTVRSVTISSDTGVPVATVVSTSAVPSPLVKATAVITPNTVVSTSTVPSVGIAASGTVSVSAVASTSSVPSININIGTIVSVSTVASTSTVRTVTIAHSANVGVATVASTSTVPSIVASAVPTLAVNTVASTSTVQTVTLRATANVAVSTVAATASVPAVTIQTGGNQNVPVTTVASTSTVRSVTIATSADVAVAAVASTSTVPSVAPRTTAVAAVSTVAAISTVPSVAITVSEPTTVPIATVVSTSVVPSIAPQISATVQIATVASTSAVHFGAIKIDISVFVNTVASISTVPSISIFTIPPFTGEVIANVINDGRILVRYLTTGDIQAQPKGPTNTMAILIKE